MRKSFRVMTPEETVQVGRELAASLAAGQLVLFEGPLGAGKTTMIRGVLEALGHRGSVRSPTFNLIQTFATDPPVMHADLYRVSSTAGLGLEDYLQTHLCLVEWPERLGSLEGDSDVWWVRLVFTPEGREISIESTQPF